jgi:bifunctional non-homologous end joining protein LigD
VGTTPEDALDEYRQRRDFSATPEPTLGGADPADGAPRFVIQRHDARALHFDLRLERGGTLASWAVPKGLPLHGGVKRLAVRTEDHPLDYLDFAAVIPEGQYGGGRMTIWDRGTYSTVSITDDEWKIVISGQIVSGEYHLIRTGSQSGREQWLVFRAKAAGPGAPDPAADFRALRPMLAGTDPAATDDARDLVELKWDGYRALALVTGDGVRLQSRSGRDITDDYPELRGLRRALLSQEAILDGEICVLDADGKSDFQALQRHASPVRFVVFDILFRDGRWVTDFPLRERREILAVSVDTDHREVVVSDYVVGSGAALFAAAREQGLEGVVAKRLDSVYRPGRRSPEWRKVKTRQDDDLVIGGFTTGEGSRRDTFGALLVGRPDADGLVFVSNVGSGFTDATAREIRGRLDTMPRATSPFRGVPVDLTEPHWCEPQLWARVVYAEVTSDGHLRAPVFAGLVDPPDDAAPPAPDDAAAPAGDAQTRVVVDGDRSTRLTNLTKVYWPGEGITKGDVLDHYLAVSTALVPHLAGRAMILKRYPNGISAPFFFQHNIPDNAPEWLTNVRLGRGENSEKENHYAVIDDPLALLWVINLGCIDLNPWQSRAASPREPTHVLFDLDPAEGMPFDAVIETALLLNGTLEELGLRGYPKTSGASGMHIFVPVGPGLSYDVTRLFAHVVYDRLARERPDLLTTVVPVAKRGRRLYLDANQNGRGRSVASVYSIRPRPGAPVSTPLTWDEVTPGLDPRAFTREVVAARLAQHGDLFSGALDDPQPLVDAIARLSA